MPRFRRILAVACAALAVTAGPAAAPALAHGSMQNPLSRVEGCYLEGAENPRSAACRAAVATGGTAALYDWMSLRIGEAAGRHRQLIPDGKLCSAGNEMYKGLDLPRADWPATSLKSGASFTFDFRATAPHKGTFQLYLTNSSYSPTRPLAWSNLDPQPFLTATDPQLVNGSYLLTGKIPAGRTGRQLIYLIWQRSDSPEAFYSCSDVVFDGTGTVTAPTTAPAAAGHSHSPSPGPSPSPSRSAGAAPTPVTPVTSAAPVVPSAPDTPDSRPLTQPVAHSDTGSARSRDLLLAIGAAFTLAAVVLVVRHRLLARRGRHR
ncbi:lytic polysaccharide monooxygenase auxiliary activity family 9 protein [Kitasatospora cheerisanensis]|uniref:Chitin-binding type-4 domain-containing protein n=1 Tax=Kitasatospora cheerisanensis KCTC 2395 TaxID=1348663 RepID=A0A066YPV5_9ACTN|nr:lytic polysaccharide monooxygenase [Kitasatospora cheerisanensis]KDN82019.1 hypothetical protein KCH_61730 [Kitasatospora cheerisanensis KCTC 2395]